MLCMTNAVTEVLPQPFDFLQLISLFLRIARLPLITFSVFSSEGWLLLPSLLLWDVSWWGNEAQTSHSQTQLLIFPGWLILCLLRLPRRRSRVSGSAQHFSSTRHSPNPSSIRSNKFIQYFFLLHYYRRSILGVIFLSFLFSPLEMQLWVFSFPDVSPAFRMCVLKPISRLAKWISECGETGLLPLVFTMWPRGSSNSTTQLLAREAELQLAALLGDWH